MKTFNDNAGRTWTVSITVDAVKRVRDLLSVNLMEAIDGDLLERLAADPILLCDIVYAICKPQADTQGINDTQFGEAMGGDAIDLATTALLEELVAFFPPARRRVLSKALAKMRAVEEKAMQFAEERLDDPELDRQIEQALRTSTASSSSLPPSPGPIPAPAPSES